MFICIYIYTCINSYLFIGKEEGGISNGGNFNNNDKTAVTKKEKKSKGYDRSIENINNLIEDSYHCISCCEGKNKPYKFRW
jgi:hypothetical protein